MILKLKRRSFDPAMLGYRPDLNDRFKIDSEDRVSRLFREIDLDKILLRRTYHEKDKLGGKWVSTWGSSHERNMKLRQANGFLLLGANVCRDLVADPSLIPASWRRKFKMHAAGAEKSFEDAPVVYFYGTILQILNGNYPSVVGLCLDGDQVYMVTQNIYNIMQHNEYVALIKA